MSLSAVKEGEAKLWFKTQEEINDYDDRMIAAIELKSEDFDDPNFSPLFTRARKEFFLAPNELFKKEYNEFVSPMRSRPYTEYLDKYYGGKKNHSFWREWTIERSLFAGSISYFLLRDLPVRNFYARCWIMLWLYGKFCISLGVPKMLWPGVDMKVQVKHDQYFHKIQNHYDAWRNVWTPLLPTYDNKVPERYAWKMRQPAYLDDAITSSAFTTLGAIFGNRQKEVQWDGTFTQPLQRLCDPKHKDAKYINFITV